MKVYLAAPYPLRDQAIVMMLQLEILGHVVTSRWLRVKDDDGPQAAAMDLQDIDEADALLAWNPPGWENIGTGGRHFEFGYAFAEDKLLVLLGKRSSNFHHMAGVRVIERLEDL